jgi:hypothetical protein
MSLRKLLLLLFVLLIAFVSNAQRLQWSLGSGATIYKGDMQDWALYPNSLQIKQILPSLSIELGYQKTQSFNYRAQLLLTGIQGNSAIGSWSKGGLGGLNGSFRSSIVELGVLVDYHFLDYHDSPKAINWTPYLYGGFATFFADPQNSLLPSSALPPTTVNAPEVMNGSFISFAIPFGIGIKYQISPKWGIKWEAGSRKTLTDRLDGWITKGADRSNFTTSFTDQYMNTSFSITFSIDRIYCPSEYQN